MPSTRSLLPGAGGHPPGRDGCPPRTFELDVTFRSSRPLSRSELGASEITHRSELSRRHQAPPASFCSTARLTSTPRESTAPDTPLGSRAVRSAPKSITPPADASPSREPSPDATQAPRPGRPPRGATIAHPSSPAVSIRSGTPNDLRQVEASFSPGLPGESLRRFLLSSSRTRGSVRPKPDAFHPCHRA